MTKQKVKSEINKKEGVPSVKKATSKKKKLIAKKEIVKHVKRAEPKHIFKIIPKFQKKFVFVGVCGNCAHVPIKINSLVALMSVLVVILSGVVLIQSGSINFSELIVKASGSSISIDQTIAQK